MGFDMQIWPLILHSVRAVFEMLLCSLYYRRGIISGAIPSRPATNNTAWLWSLGNTRTCLALTGLRLEGLRILF
jgi:hypothetical protein